MRNFLITITYDGSCYHGWQIQNNAVTVQEVFQNALVKVLGESPDIKACSRTDSGVHANMFCISMQTEHSIPPERLKGALNNFLPLSVAVLDCKEVDSDFHARYDCKGKRYVYKIWNSPVRNPFLKDYALHYRWKIDEKLLNKSAQDFVGKHDFTSFCTADNRKMENMERTITDFSVTRQGDMVIMSVEADGFLYNMVRIMVGTLLKIQQGQIPADGIPAIFEQKSRNHKGITAPPQGLYLEKVKY
ncbi:MAG: tRNA pseudouridine(38-40) synthase TruA [Oscillospiraceae bacterium]|nr:tRNA pseudouridine(38-40) synthase TruA [Oscillospiraceae bacterium]